MIVTLHAHASPADVAALTALTADAQLVARRVSGAPDRIVLGATSLAAPLHHALRALPGVAAVTPSATSYPLCSRAGAARTTRVQVGQVTLGGDAVVLVAGPCAVEDHDQLMQTAIAARAAGATLLRGGAFKPRTNPYAFAGLGQAGLDLLASVGAQTGLGVVTEVMAVADIPQVAAAADALQIGARNMQNYPLLRAVGQQPKPVVLKRGLSATYAEWLMAAEYIYAQGNGQIILCERGIRTFETATRNTLDLAAVPVLRELTHLPILIDPSHGTGARAWVTPMARAAVAVGADGVMVEAHPNPDVARSDGAQSLTLPMLHALGQALPAVAQAVGRTYVLPA